MDIKSSAYRKCLIVEIGYNYYAIPITEAIEVALPDILSVVKVSHDNSNIFKVSSERPDLKLYIGEVENANN